MGKVIEVRFQTVTYLVRPKMLDQELSVFPSRLPGIPGLAEPAQGEN